MTMEGLALRARGVQFSYFDQAMKDTLQAIERIDLDQALQEISATRERVKMGAV